MLIKESLVADVKSVKDGIIHGMGVQFGSPETKDWDGEFFVPESELGLVNGANRPFIMEHGFSKNFGVTKVADAVYEKSDTGWLYEATFLQTDMGMKAYQDVIGHPYRSSAGAAGHTRRATIVKGASQLDVWMIAEQSATLTPADPNNPRITRTKSDYMLFAITEMLKEQREYIDAKLEVYGKEFILETFAPFLDSVKDANEAREKLADALAKLKEGFVNNENGESFSSDGKFVVTEEFITAIEQVTKPIPIIGL
jgi:hypothetical protein